MAAFNWFLVAAMALALLYILRTGHIRNYMGPQSWRRVNRQDDPGRFWAFVVAMALVIAALIGQAMFG